VESEPLVGAGSLRADFSSLQGTSRYFYDLQIVSIAKDSAKAEPTATLTEASVAKKAKYRSLGTSFYPLVISAGGLMQKDTAKTYKALQRLVGPAAASWMDTSVALTLLKTRAHAAASITRS